MIQPEQMVQMSDEEIKKLRLDILWRKKDNAKLIADSTSSAGKLFLQRRKELLEEVRKQYNSIRAMGVPAEDFRLQILAIQVRERLIMDDIKAIESSNEIAKTLDKELEQCNHDLLRREKALESER